MINHRRDATNAGRAGLEPVSVALQRISPLDAEVIRLRHQCEMTNNDAAAVLEVPSAVASRLYVRALRRLGKQIADEASGFVPFSMSDTNLRSSQMLSKS